MHVHVTVIYGPSEKLHLISLYFGENTSKMHFYGPMVAENRIGQKLPNQME